jgi:hypothetical protein
VPKSTEKNQLLQRERAVGRHLPKSESSLIIEEDVTILSSCLGKLSSDSSDYHLRSAFILKNVEDVVFNTSLTKNS